jgi:single-stranded-DNA-specific exonuclease
MENRAICNMGFSNVANLGLYSLLKSDSMCSSDIGYTVAPLVNAANRMDDNWPALQLFTSNSSDAVKNVIKILEGHKTSQRAIVDKVFATFDELVEPQKDNLCYVFKVSNCRNLSGLLATKAVDKYGKPCLVVTDSENTLDGSMRSTKSENFSAMINGTGLAQCDGHENSAGISIPKENLEELINRLNVELDGYEFTADISIDVQINRNQITPMLLDSIAEYNRITGNGFGEIRVLIDNIMDYSIRELSGGKHLSVEVPDMKFLKWNFNEWYNVLENSELSAIGTLSVNNFMGRKSVQMIMEDYNFSIPSTTNNLFF